MRAVVQYKQFIEQHEERYELLEQLLVSVISTAAQDYEKQQFIFRMNDDE